MNRLSGNTTAAALLAAVVLAGCLSGCGGRVGAKAGAVKKITVSNAVEFIEALGPDRVIELKPGRYNLTEAGAGEFASEWVSREDVDDGFQLVLNGVRNLTIRGVKGAKGGEKPDIVVDPRRATVLTFFNCSDIVIDGIAAGHSDGGECSGDVFRFSGGGRITINGASIYGSGAAGLRLYNVSGVKVTNSRIYDCTSEIMEVSEGDGVVFKKCSFDNNNGGVTVRGVKNMSFTECKFSDNRAGNLFDISDNVSVSVSRTVFSGNTIGTPVASSANVSFKDCKFDEASAVPDAEEAAKVAAEEEAAKLAAEESRAAKITGWLTDSRDGAWSYTTVKIGEQVWMAKNLNYNASGSTCYENDKDNCDKYGRLYDWETAKNACPKGSHLPSREEWTTLVLYTKTGTTLKSKSGWNGDCGSCNGTDDYGFSALPGGISRADGGFENDIFGFWWTATEDSEGYAYYRGMYFDSDDVLEDINDKNDGFSVRCLVDQ